MQDIISCNFNLEIKGDDIYVNRSNSFFSLIIGLIRGGKLRKMKAINNKTIWLLIFGILMQYILVFLNQTEAIGSLSKILSYTKEILIISYILILIGIFTNLKFRSLWLSLIGFILNFFCFNFK